MRVEVRNLGFGYPSLDGSVRQVLSDLDLVVEEGSVHGVVGPNGCGKSTLLRLLAGLEKPTSGTVDILGDTSHAHKTALVFQNPRLIGWWTVERNVSTGSEFTETPGPLLRRLREFHTSQVGLGELRNRFPGTLSLGQQARAGLGRGLAHDAAVMLLDEPFTHLDALSRRRLQEEFETFWQLEPRTTVLVTHDIDEAVSMSDRVSVMSATPGPLVDTVEVGAGRPRAGLSPAHPGLLGAVRTVWEALDATRP